MNDETPERELVPLANSHEGEAVLDSEYSGHTVETTANLQLFAGGSLLFGIFDDVIATIEQWRQPAPLPHAPPAVLGVVSIQGRMLTVLDLLTLLGETADRDHPSHGFIVALRGDEQIALAIENKAGALEVAMKEIKPTSESGRPIHGFICRGNQLVIVLDVKALFNSAVKGRQRRRRRF